MGQFTARFSKKRRRSCGPCTVCCFVGEVKEFGHKPAYSPCPHQVTRGCGIYPERPSVCREFECVWLSGQGRTDDRPDKLGVFLTFVESDFGRICQIHEVLEGMLEAPAVVDYVRRLKVADKCIVIGVTQRGNYVIAGPSAKVQRYREHIRASRNAGLDTGFLQV